MPRLLVKKREEIVAEYVFKKNKIKIFIGSRKGNDVVLVDKNISEQHCTILFEGEQYFIKDQNTITGTQLNYRNIAESPLKLRLVVDAVRGKDVVEALGILSLLNKKGSKTVAKAVNSGIASAKELYGATEENLVINKISVDAGSTLKRTRFASRGRVSRILKRRSHINLELKVR